METGAPSEPILAEAAGRLMHMGGFRASLLEEYVETAWINKGQRGELVTRLLVTLAHDKALRTGDGPPTYFSKKIPVLDFLSALFRPEYMSSIRMCRPQNGASTQTLEDAFKGSYVHFTHFGKAGSLEVFTDEGMLWAMVRGMAFQFYGRRQGIDISIPIAMWDEKLGRETMSVIVLQIKNSWTNRFVTVDLEGPRLEFFTSVKDVRANTRPYIVIFLEFDVRQPTTTVQTQPSASIQGESSTPTPMPGPIAPSIPRDANTRKRKHPRYVLKATGCSSKVYNVIMDDERDVYNNLLASHDIFDEHPRQDTKCLDAIRELKPSWKSGSAFYGWAEPTKGESRIGNNAANHIFNDEGDVPVMEDDESDED